MSSVAQVLNSEILESLGKTNWTICLFFANLLFLESSVGG